MKSALALGLALGLSLAAATGAASKPPERHHGSGHKSSANSGMLQVPGAYAPNGKSSASALGGGHPRAAPSRQAASFGSSYGSNFGETTLLPGAAAKGKPARPHKSALY